MTGPLSPSHWAFLSFRLQAFLQYPPSLPSVSFQRDCHPKASEMSVSRKLPSAAILLAFAARVLPFTDVSSVFVVQERIWGEGEVVLGVGGIECACLWAGRGTGASCAVAVGEEVNWATAEPRCCLGYWQVGTWGLLQDRNTLPEAWLPPLPACLGGKEGC